VRLKSITLTGFKSFPDRTRLDFGQGVSVVVGPNGSGKSNVTDAVLWAMGEQSPLAVRGQAMQDVISAGGRGVQARSAAEVEIVLENSDGSVEVPMSEISVMRRLNRTGDGEYRLNGARCRLTDVIEVLSPAGLGKATHSIVSQGRVEEIVISRPRERRLLIEEAAGLGKHRKRRRRAQLKLERTQENLDRVLDVEREARTRLRPLKRQAEAAELHERLERQMLEARWELARDSLRARRVELEGAEERVEAAREQRAGLESQLQTVANRRARAERALTERAERHDELARRLYAARSAGERVGLRGEQVGTSAQVLARRIGRIAHELERLGEAGGTVSASPGAHTPGAPQPSGTQPPDQHFWSEAWDEVRSVIVEGVERVLAQADVHGRSIEASAVAQQAERVARAAVERALAEGRISEEAFGGHAEAERLAGDGAERSRRVEDLRAQHASDIAAAPLGERLRRALVSAAEAVDARVEQFEGELARDRGAGEEVAGELRACAGQEAEIQTELRAAGDLVTQAEVAAQRLRDQAGEAELELSGIVERLGSAPAQAPGDPDLGEEQVRALLGRVERLARRREQLGPVNPLAQDEYAQAVAHVEEMEGRRADLETALRELRALIRDTDRQIQRTFQETFEAVARNFEELAGEVFPRGSGRLRLVSDEQAPRPVLGGQPLPGGSQGADAEAAEADLEAEDDWEELTGEELLGVEIEITPAGKSTKRLSLLSGGEKSMTALAFMFAVFLARPCPFYVLDEVEAALDDLNLDRFLALLRRYANRAQFIVITHQKRTMEAADWLYGVSMGGDGVSKVLSRRLPPVREAQASSPVAEVA
jgi:chromosome segregation ATPase